MGGMQKGEKTLKFSRENHLHIHCILLCGWTYMLENVYKDFTSNHDLCVVFKS